MTLLKTTFASLLIPLVALLISISFSKYEWGYYFQRPGVLPQLGDIATVTAVRLVHPPSDRDTRRYWEEPDPSASIAGCEDGDYWDRYHGLKERTLCELQRRGLLPETYSGELADYMSVLELVDKANIPTTPTADFEYTELFFGVRVDAEDEEGNALVILAMHTDEISNDHFAFFEACFEEGADGSLHLGKKQHFFYDSAGIEGTEWYVVFFPALFPAPPS